MASASRHPPTITTQGTRATGRQFRDLWHAKGLPELREPQPKRQATTLLNLLNGGIAFYRGQKIRVTTSVTYASAVDYLTDTIGDSILANSGNAEMRELTSPMGTETPASQA